MITETDRLVLRHFNEGDIEALFQMNSIPEILTYIPTEPFTDRAQAEKLLHEVIYADYSSRGFGRWAVEHRESGKVIGFCGPKYIPEFDKVELGYRYFPEYWGQGIGAEAAKAAIAEFKSICKVDEAIALILDGNLGSMGVARKVGMEPNGRSEFMGHGVTVFHRWL
ncbi:MULTISPECIES: GNAT family N-acetyltransferase [Shewanella]|uniref:GNAT family N-acetyltransferase n=2 Tax=Shewanella TaxID=22 RepID=A0A975ALU3_9GAMM|nr:MULTISPECIES: GNAT family N-acetyltransferase [Shewanella]QSX31812.1 GNAT family N-acetyltransferase [Shewanella cyperi]QSX39023.1 GNAT family N-acetyltransferase [Shewanella sedimentimangrovi]QSX42581.1 GNAT family N-acetyltransferase [Shewanella cyperi]